jgi:hypothetical protein
MPATLLMSETAAVITITLNKAASVAKLWRAS